jgi:hypothetical protein
VNHARRQAQALPLAARHRGHIGLRRAIFDCDARCYCAIDWNNGREGVEERGLDLGPKGDTGGADVIHFYLTLRHLAVGRNCLKRKVSTVWPKDCKIRISDTACDRFYVHSLGNRRGGGRRTV